MARGLAVVAVGAWVGIANASPTHQVTIQSDPPGAKVYFNQKEDGTVCETTPCTVPAPIGQTPAIIELDKYGPQMIMIDVPKRIGKPIVFKVKLLPAVGTLVVESAAATGAVIKVDDADKGKVPAHIDLEAGGHHVVVTIDGKTLYDEFVNIEIAEEVSITPKSPAVASKTKDTPADAGGGDDGGNGGSDADVHITKTSPSPPRNRFITAAALVDVGFRRFSYVDVMRGSLGPEREDGQVIAGPAIELWPAELLHSSHLRGLSLFGRAEFGLNHQPVVLMSGAPAGMTTFWGSYEASLRNRWDVADTVLVEASAGWVRDQLEFNADSSNDLLKVPNADYQSIRIGVKVGLLLGDVEPYLSAENRIVLSEGELATRFSGASASGLRAALGATARLGALWARAEASLTRYSWTFSNVDTSAMDAADSATDSVTMLEFSLGYVY